MSTIAEELTRIQTAKTALRTALVAKGATLADNATLDTFPAAVEALPSGGSTWSDDVIRAICENNTDITIDELVIPEGVRNIGERALEMLGMKTVTLPSTLTGIYDRAFFCCTDLESITIPSNVKFINHKVFDSCYRLSSITFLGTVYSSNNTDGISLRNDAFSDINSAVDVYINVYFPNETYENVQLAENYPWGLPTATVIHCSNGNLAVP